MTGGLGALGREVVRLLLDDDDCAGCRVLVIGRQSASGRAARGVRGRRTSHVRERRPRRRLRRASRCARQILRWRCAAHRLPPSRGNVRPRDGRRLSSDLAAATRTDAGAVPSNAIELSSTRHLCTLARWRQRSRATASAGTRRATSFSVVPLPAQRCAVDARCIAWASWGNALASRRATRPSAWRPGSRRCPPPRHRRPPRPARRLRRRRPPAPPRRCARARRRNPPAVVGGDRRAKATLRLHPDQLPSLDAIAAGAIPVCVPKLPRTADGSVDVDALRTLPLKS